MTTWTNKTKNTTSILFLVDSYSESNWNNNILLRNDLNHYCGQCFSVSQDAVIISCKFYLEPQGAIASGMMIAYLYEMTGTFGTDGKPTGNQLDITDSINITSLTTNVFTLKEFIFQTGYTLKAGSHYCVIIGYSGTQLLCVGRDTTGEHAGNMSYSSDGNSWTASSTNDILFYVYGTNTYINHTKHTATYANPIKNT
jgi:hypothetical protein